MRGVLNRLHSNNKQTLGHFTLYNDVYKIFDCYTLELADNQNRKNISRIPSGVYLVKKRFSRKFKTHFEIKNVFNRDLILMHTGNYYTDIDGCILLGKAITDINNDGLRDVINSRITNKVLVSLVKDSFYLNINNMEL